MLEFMDLESIQWYKRALSIITNGAMIVESHDRKSVNELKSALLSKDRCSDRFSLCMLRCQWYVRRHRRRYEHPFLHPYTQMLLPNHAKLFRALCTLSSGLLHTSSGFWLRTRLEAQVASIATAMTKLMPPTHELMMVSVYS